MSGSDVGRRWLLASRNRGKAEEFARMLQTRAVEIVPGYIGVEEVVAEGGETYRENALIKARWAAERTGEPALADDSGLEVDALDGRPGLFSARYAGGDPANLHRVLVELLKVRWEDRGATMRAVVALVLPDGRAYVGEGRVRGRMATAPRGLHGFGYDPGFILPDGRTAAEHTPAEKDLVSHRRQALEALWSDIISGQTAP